MLFDGSTAKKDSHEANRCENGGDRSLEEKYGGLPLFRPSCYAVLSDEYTYIPRIVVLNRDSNCYLCRSEVRVGGSNQDPSRTGGMADTKNAQRTGLAEDHFVDSRKWDKQRRLWTSEILVVQSN